ncbi:MAG TPA: dihydroxyacetone kinase subunit DhaL [Rhizobiaceae bacterium]|nr:dihydroxyacetone kinase subunit DhaL [Rhizobiaceae bacterium]
MTQADLITRLVSTAQAVVSRHADELTQLDQAIGDGDHGSNLKRGFDAVASEAAALAEKPVGEALKAAGMKLVMTVGGASGPLFGTMLMTLGKELGDAPDRAAFASAFSKAVDAVAARGKSQQGQKTLLDVLYPVSDALAQGKSGGEIAAIAAGAADATVPVKATRGRASFLGERSIGHMDPGARSVSLLIAAVAPVLEGK